MTEAAPRPDAPGPPQPRSGPARSGAPGTPDPAVPDPARTAAPDPSPAAAPDPPPAALGRVRPGRPLVIALAALVVALAVGVSVGPADLSLTTVAEALLVRLPWHPALSVPPIDVAIVWQIRLPRVILGALVGAMLAGGGAAYQGVFRNPLADPYLLGVAAGPAWARP